MLTATTWKSRPASSGSAWSAVASDAEGEPAQRFAAQVFEHQDYRPAGKELSQSHAAAVLVGEVKIERQLRSRMRIKRREGQTGGGCAGQTRPSEQQQDQQPGHQGLHGEALGKPGMPFAASSFIALAIGMWTMPFCLSIQ